MDTTIASFLLLFAAAVLGGAMNAVAGGGSFVAFPALVFTGVPSVEANATNALALFPGQGAAAWAYRDDVHRFNVVPLRRLMTVSLIGALVGAALLLLTPQRVFDGIVAWLLLIATLTFAFGPKLAPKLRQIAHIGPVTLLVIQFVLAVYGGYFGGAVGIMMLATWSLLGHTDMNAMNAVKTLVSCFINVVAVGLFIVAGKIFWPQALVMIVGAILGGYLAAHISRGLDQRIVRGFVIVISVTMTIVFFLRA